MTICGVGAGLKSNLAPFTSFTLDPLVFFNQ